MFVKQKKVKVSTKEYLELVEQLKALEQSAGAWSLKNHPELKDDKDIDKWFKESRKNWR